MSLSVSQGDTLENTGIYFNDRLNSEMGKKVKLGHNP